jgi:hypothetical protein
MDTALRSVEQKEEDTVRRSSMPDGPDPRLRPPAANREEKEMSLFLFLFLFLHKCMFVLKQHDNTK